jgi:hypothetical protein
MNRRSILGLILAPLIAAATPSLAFNVKLSASEIEAVLAGNTIIGTIYVPKDGKRDEGRWRTNPETNDYESWWRSTGWTPYALVRTDGGGFAWVNGDRLEPFQIQQGRQVE